VAGKKVALEASGLKGLLRFSDAVPLNMWMHNYNFDWGESSCKFCPPFSALLLTIGYCGRFISRHIAATRDAYE